jgi:type I restriction enzyme S subunit
MSELTLSAGTQPIDVAGLPQGWRANQLKDFCTFMQGGRHGLTKQDHYRSSGVPAFSAAGQDGYVDITEFRNTDAVVLSAIGANCGRCFVATGDWTTLANVQVVIPDPKEAHARFLHYRVDRDDYWPRSGSAQPFVKPSDIRSCWIALPPLGQQLAVVRVLDTLDTAIHETEAIIAKLKAVKQGLLHDLLTRGIDANGELRPPQAEVPHLYKQSPLGWIPKEWEVAPLGDLSESLVDGPFGSNLKTAHYVENPGVRVVRLQNILAGEYDDSERAFISERHAACMARNRVTAGDALIASLGDARYPVGRSCCYPADLPDAINKADCFRFRSGPRCLNEFVMLSMNGATARKQVRGYEQGVTMKRINLGNLRRVEIPLPSISEQEMISVRLGVTQKQIDVTSLELRKLQFEKAGLMDDLLTGRVRVTPLLEAAP